MKHGIAAVALLLAATVITVAEPGGGTTVQRDPEKQAPAGNPNNAEPGLEEQGWKADDATYVPVLKDFNIKTFNGGFAAVMKKGDGQVLPLPVQDKGGVSVKSDANALEIDGNHDGKMEERLKSDGATALVTLQYPNGETTPYAVRVQKSGTTWNWQRSGYWVATVNKVQIGILDNNNNGLYDENGADAVSVGLNGYAIPMSDVILAGGTLYRLKVAESGKKIYVKEYDGELGKLDAVTDYKTVGRLACAVFQNGATYLDLANSKDKAVSVPTGSYTFFGGELRARSGKECATMKTGTFAPVAVKKDETTKLAWGMDVKIEFEFDIAGGQVSVLYSTVHVFGSAGEEYFNFSPVTMCPSVLVLNAETNDQAQKGTMSLC